MEMSAADPTVQDSDSSQGEVRTALYDQSPIVLQNSNTEAHGNHMDLMKLDCMGDFYDQSLENKDSSVSNFSDSNLMQFNTTDNVASISNTVVVANYDNVTEKGTTSKTWSIESNSFLADIYQLTSSCYQLESGMKSSLPKLQCFLDQVNVTT